MRLLTVRRSAGVVGLVAVAAACSGAPAHSPARPPTTAPAGRLAGVEVEDSVAPVWRPPPGTAGVSQEVYYALVASNGLRVTVAAKGGGCIEDAHLTATESPTQVVLHLLGYELRAKNQGCFQDLRLWTRSVTLSTPLASRELLDGSTGAQIDYFDGRQLASVGWLPDGAHGPLDRPAPDGWARSYTFHQRTAAPVEIDQMHGDVLHSPPFTDTDYIRHQVSVNAHTGTLLERRVINNVLGDERLGWVQDGYTFVVQSLPAYWPQQPIPPSVLLHIAAAVTTHGEGHTNSRAVFWLLLALPILIAGLVAVRVRRPGRDGDRRAWGRISWM